MPTAKQAWGDLHTQWLAQQPPVALEVYYTIESTEISLGSSMGSRLQLGHMAVGLMCDPVRWDRQGWLCLQQKQLGGQLPSDSVCCHQPSGLMLLPAAIGSSDQLAAELPCCCCHRPCRFGCMAHAGGLQLLQQLGPLLLQCVDRLGHFMLLQKLLLSVLTLPLFQWRTPYTGSATGCLAASTVCKASGTASISYHHGSLSSSSCRGTLWGGFNCH